MNIDYIENLTGCEEDLSDLVYQVTSIVFDETAIKNDWETFKDMCIGTLEHTEHFI